MAVSTVMAAYDVYIQEELPSQIIETGPKVDPIYSYQVRTSENVVSKGIGRGWEFMHAFSSGVSGAIQPRANTGGAPYTNTENVVFHNTQLGHPNPNEMPHVTTVNRILDLNCHFGNYSIPTFLLKPEALEGANFDQALRDFRGLVTLRAQLEAVSFYSPSAGYLGTLPADGNNTDGATDYIITFTPGSSRMKWWKKGMMVDVFDDALGTNKINEYNGTTDCPLVVSAVDYINETVTLTNWSGNYALVGDNNTLYGSDDLDGSATRYVFPRGVVQGHADVDGGGTLYQTGHYGLDDWLIDTGTLFGDAKAWTPLGNDKTAAFTIANNPEFASVVESDLAAPLTDLTMNNKVGQFLEAYDDSILDTLITTQKVINKYIEGAGLGPNRFNYDRDGKSLNIMGGYRKVGYEYDGQIWDVVVSHYCQSGTLYMVKLGEGNLKRYVPPRARPLDGNAPGTGLGLDGEVEFLNGIVNNGQIFSLVGNTTTGQATPLAEAPFYQYSQVAPVDVRGIKIAGITESG